MMKAYIMSKNGTITIPSDLRKRKNIKPGTKIFVIDEGNNLRIKFIDKSYFHGLIGITKTNGKALKSILREKINENY